MPLRPIGRDGVDILIGLERRVQALELRRLGQHVENFILDPVVPRRIGQALAIRQRIIGVMLYHTSSGPVTVNMVVERETPPLDEPNPWVLKANVLDANTFEAVAADTVHYRELGITLVRGDIYYPEIVDGDGGALTASFIVAL